MTWLHLADDLAEEFTTALSPRAARAAGLVSRHRTDIGGTGAFDVQCPCGIHFNATHPQARYCSDRCNWNAVNRRRQVLPTIRTCACGKTFATTTGSRRIHCGDACNRTTQRRRLTARRALERAARTARNAGLDEAFVTRVAPLAAAYRRAGPSAVSGRAGMTCVP